MVAGMEDDEAHPSEHPLLDAIDESVGHLVMRDVTPP